MKKYLYLFLALILFLPIGVLAEDVTDKLYIDIEIKEDGSLFVRELASLAGNYNGRLRNIDYQNVFATHFTGIPSDFGGSDIYNASEIINVKVYDVLNKKDITFNSINKLNYEFSRVDYAESGTYGVYTLENTTNGVNLKIFNPSSTNSAFYIEYQVLDAVVVHSDVAELAWNILGNSYEENIEDLIVKVHLPKKDSSMRVWAHGPLNGNIERTSDDTVTLTYDFLGAYNPVDVRIVFAPLVTNATKRTNIEALNHILNYENDKAEEANREREKIKSQNNIVKAITVFWYLLLSGTIIFVYIKCDKERKTHFDMQYYRDFPDTYGPEILEYLLKKNVSSIGFSASILQIVSKKALKIEQVMGKKKEYKFIKVEENMSFLTSQESNIVSLLINEIGNGKEVTLKEIKSYGKKLSKAKKFMSSYNKWVTDTKIAGETYELFDSHNFLRIVASIIAILGWGVMVLNLSFETNFVLGYLAFFVGIVAIIYFVTFKKRTEKGALQYQQWMAFKRFLLDFGRMDEKELPEVALWEKYLVYATVLGCAKKVEKEMRIKIENMNVTETNSMSFSDYYLMHALINSDIASTVSNTINKAVSSSRSSIAASQSSSSGGYGGGVSSGGGSFGGGGGGGRF